MGIFINKVGYMSHGAEKWELWYSNISISQLRQGKPVDLDIPKSWPKGEIISIYI